QHLAIADHRLRHIAHAQLLRPVENDRPHLGVPPFSPPDPVDWKWSPVATEAERASAPCRAQRLELELRSDPNPQQPVCTANSPPCPCRSGGKEGLGWKGGAVAPLHRQLVHL